MYKALKSAQNDIQEVLLKMVDEIGSVNSVQSAVKVDTSKCPRGEPCQCALITQAQAQPQAQAQVPNDRLEGLENTLQFLHQKQNAQYEVLVDGIQQLNISLSNIVKILAQQAEKVVETATTIPNLSPQAHGSDLKNVCVDISQEAPLASEAPQTLDTPRELDEDEQSAIAGDITPDIDDVEEEEEAEEEEEVVVEEEEDEEGIEVEEWTYKGRKFFKDSENKVYANDNGEIGDAIGLYDPVKNIVKKIPV